jgi:tRNA-Thr(GGU) m(6)t(6)A37 methyltransferase TsaA
MTTTNSYLIQPIGFVRSELKDRDAAPRQSYEGSPDAWIEIKGEFADGLQGIEARQEIILITWFHESRRDKLKVHPRGDRNVPQAGVFATRSPERPNPLGLHRVTVREVVANRIKVGPLEAIDGTPVVDIKPVLRESADS